MSFNNIKIKKTKRKKEISIFGFSLKSLIFYSLLLLFTFFVAFFSFIYIKFIKPLPPISQLEKIQIKESSIIYDRNWKQLYMFWDEKRTYVTYDKISKNILNAIVSWEDKTFYQNSWFDISWLIRAVLYRISWKTDKIEWTSTISQQLIKIVFLSKERSLERKIKEAYLSFRMNVNYSKEKILELYLNKISFWSNAFGIEQAALTFFWKSAKDVNILEWSILASLPKWPTLYSPYSHYDNLVWYFYTYHKSDDTTINKLIKKEDLLENSTWSLKFNEIITNLKWTRVWENWLNLCWLDNSFLKKKMNIDWQKCSLIKYSDLLWFLNNIQIILWEEVYEYQTWRKDFILWRLLEDNKITFDEYKSALKDSIWLEFKQYVENIKYPHFVLYVKDFLNQKYWEELMSEWWLRIYTTLDSELQDKADEILKKQVASNKAKFNANNWALISIDNKSWDILAFIWWADYFDKTIDWNVNMLTSKRQPWSTFKSFVYALAIDKNPIWPYTPIYDLKTVFPWKYEPKNFDWKFLWKMDVIRALDYSRNIPAIKAYYLAWWQASIIKYLQTAWVKSLKLDWDYGAPLALWGWEMTPLELTQAYSVFPNMWKKIDIDPILKILDSKWLPIYKKRIVSWTQVLDESTAYIMNFILSSAESRPNDYWNKFLTLNKRPVWAKTWTSNKVFLKNWKKDYFPWDLWTAWFTPQITTVVWAWNTNWKQIDATWDWLNWAWSIWKEYMEFAHKWKDVLQFEKPKNLKYASISKISWLLAPENFDPNFVISSMFKNVPTTYDSSLKPIQIDILCNWKVGDLTPVSAIKNWYYLALNDIDPKNATWQESVQERLKSWNWEKEFAWYNNIITNYNDTECQRDENSVLSSNIEVKTNINEDEWLVIWKNQVEIAYRSVNPVKKIQISLWEKVIYEITEVAWKKSWIYKWNIIIPEWWKQEDLLTIKVFDDIFYSWEEIKKIKISATEKTIPKITITNPENWSISLYQWTFFNLRWKVEDRSAIKSINVYIDDVPYKLWLIWNDFVVEIWTDSDLSIWNHNIKIEAIDNYFNKWYSNITLEVLPK